MSEPDKFVRIHGYEPDKRSLVMATLSLSSTAARIW